MSIVLVINLFGFLSCCRDHIRRQTTAWYEYQRWRHLIANLKSDEVVVSKTKTAPVQTVDAQREA